MLAIRLQRTGRSGHAQFRLIVQDARLNPSSGKVVAQIGSYNPHTKAVVVNKEKASFYLEHGAQPSERIVLLMKKEGVKLPKWVTKTTKKEGKIRNPDKLRKNRPADAEPPKSVDSQELPAEDASETLVKASPSPDQPEVPVEDVSAKEETALEEVETKEEPVEAIEPTETPSTESPEAETAETPAEKGTST